jgi:hypothetical protein
MTLTKDEAIGFARRHLDANPFPEEGIQWALEEGTLVADGWYFDYRFERIQGSDDLPLYAGAKGFLVLHDGRIQIISWPEWQKRQRTAD